MWQASGIDCGTIPLSCLGQCRMTFDTKDAQASLRFGEIFEDGVTKIVIADVAPNSPAEEVGSSLGGLRQASQLTCMQGL